MQSTSENNGLQAVKLHSANYSPPDATNDPPLIFLHGVCSTHRSFKHVMYDISKKTRRKAYAVDLRNHGKSEWPKVEYSMKLLADDLENFMIVHKIPKAVIIGHSLGGRAAMAFALRKPELVEKLIIEDMCVVDTESSLAIFKKTADIVMPIEKALKLMPSTLSESEIQKKFAGYLAQHFPETIGNASSSNISITLPFYKNKRGEFVWELDVPTLQHLGENVHLISLDLSNDPVYNGQTLLLGGDKSEVLRREDVDSFLKYFPNCQVHFLKDGYHTLHVEFPEKYKEIVTNFIGI